MPPPNPRTAVPPDRIAQFPEPSEGGVFDDGFGEGHYFKPTGHPLSQRKGVLFEFRRDGFSRSDERLSQFVSGLGIGPRFAAMMQKRRIAFACVGTVADKNRNKVARHSSDPRFP
ncbi:MAG: hypothetical protein KJ072_02630 [Verrucomicrobia bacterium]|nr:hypothetical protein [Verrucomicrobiota bacterium]